MRKKLATKTYLKDIKKYDIHMYLEKDDYYLCVKNIIEVEKNFITRNGTCLIDNGYYIVEVIPKNENYSMRVFFDQNKKRLAYYFDISLGNGIDEEVKVPYYDDLFLDVVANGNGENIVVLDEDELKEALDTNVITNEEFELANNVKDKLIEEIKAKTNKYMLLDLENMLNN